MTQEDKVNWTYDEKDYCGPKRWSKYFPTSGQYQSPINILVDHHNSNVTCCAGRLKETLKITNDKSSIIRTSGVGSVTGSVSPTASASASASSSNRSSPTQANNSSDFYDDDDFYPEDQDDQDPEQQDQGYSCQNNKITLNNNNKDKIKIKRIELRQNTRYCISQKKIFLGYPRYLNYFQLQNTGHNWQVTLPKELSLHTLLVGPSLGDREYRLEQFHCHWGANDDTGSEHQINGQSYSAELHFVHWNFSQFKSFDEACKNKHGLAVVAVFLQALDGEQNRNKHLDKIISTGGGLKKVQQKPDSSVTITQSKLDLKKLFPANRWQYATYEGSLTTPPLSEIVDWIVFLNPVQCCTSQIEQFRHIRCSNNTNTTESNNGKSLINNCRPIQPSNGRLVSIWDHH